MMIDVRFNFGLDDIVFVQVGLEFVSGVVTMLGFNGSERQYAVRTEHGERWYKEKHLRGINEKERAIARPEPPPNRDVREGSVPKG